MNEANPRHPCLYCETAAAATAYGLCESCNGDKARRRVYQYGRGRTPEWEAHLLYLTERAKLRLPLFGDGYESPTRPCRGRRKKRGAGRVPRVLHVTLPRKVRED